MVNEVNLNDMLDAAKVDFHTGYMCSETVLDVLNRFYDLGINEEAIALSTGFPYGFGDGGNICGAVAGATMALGKLFGRTTKGDPAYEKCLAVVRELNDDVAAAHGSSLCPDLIKGYDFATHERKHHCTEVVYTCIKSFAKIVERECGVKVIK